MLGVRYSNGILLNFHARALSYDTTALRVLCTEPLETGIAVNVSAPFLANVGSCSIFSVSRKPDRPGYFEIELNFLKKPALKEVADQDVAAENPLSFTAEGISRAAQEFAALLESGELQPFSRVLEQAQLDRRPMFGAASALALMLLLQDKEILDIRRLPGLASN